MSQSYSNYIFMWRMKKSFHKSFVEWLMAYKKPLQNSMIKYFPIYGDIVCKELANSREILRLLCGNTMWIIWTRRDYTSFHHMQWHKIMVEYLIWDKSNVYEKVAWEVASTHQVCMALEEAFLDGPLVGHQCCVLGCKNRLVVWWNCINF